MKFAYVPILDTMIDLYTQPRTAEGRFVPYLKLIQTADGKDMARPLQFFNPMAKEHVLKKLQLLKQVNFEEIVKNICIDLSDDDGKELQVYFNLTDDIGGGWTTKKDTTQKSYEISSLVKRSFCVIVFYVSEDITSQLIKKRAEEYLVFYKNYKQ
jgi:hypothetical protein